MFLFLGLTAALFPPGECLKQRFLENSSNCLLRSCWDFDFSLWASAMDMMSKVDPEDVGLALLSEMPDAGAAFTARLLLRSGVSSSTS